jgi:hypothetical protein
MKVEYDLYAPVGKFAGKDGKERNKTRLVGHIYAHSDGKRFIGIDPFFSIAACERKPGSDMVFLECVARVKE